MHIPEIILEACQCYGACSTMKHSILVKRYYSPKSHSLPLYPLFYFLVVVFWEIGHLIVYKYFQMNIHVNNKIMMLLSCLSFLLPFFFFFVLNLLWYLPHMEKHLDLFMYIFFIDFIFHWQR